MCDHCGCRDLTAIATLMDDHDRIAALADDLRRALAADDRSAAADHLDDLLALLLPHVAWEERGLFAELRAAGEFADHVETLEAEHAALDRSLGTARGAELLSALAALDAHIYKENFGLFPGALAALDGDAWQRIEDVRPEPSGSGVGHDHGHRLDGDRAS